MALQVLRSGKDADGDITSLCGAGWKHSKGDAIRNILSNSEAYFVVVGGRRVNVRVVPRGSGAYLTTSPDGFKPNNLDDLDDC